MDQLRYYIALLTKHIDTQIALTVSPNFSNNLPPSLIGNTEGNVKFGLKGLQICANSIMPVLLHLANNIVSLYPTHAEQFNQNINSQGYASANLAWRSVTTMRQYLAIALIFAIQSVDLRTYIKTKNYDTRSLLSDKLIPLYESVYKVLKRDISIKRPLIRHNYEQSLDEFVEKIVKDLGSHNSLIFNSLADIADLKEYINN